MKEIITRALSGFIYISLLVASLFNEYSLHALFYVFGIICMYEFSKLTLVKPLISCGLFTLVYILLSYKKLTHSYSIHTSEIIKILLVLTGFVSLFLIKDLFTEKQIPLFPFKKYLLVLFYISLPFYFLTSIAYYNNLFKPSILLSFFIIIWVNDTFAFLVGKQFGKQKLFKRISPKKTVEGFLGGLFFACVAGYFISTYTQTLNFTYWLILSIIISVFGTLGDLIESKFKRQANVKDSGNIMPGHGGLLDRLDSVIFAAPFVFLFLNFVKYVS